MDLAADRVSRTGVAGDAQLEFGWLRVPLDGKKDGLFLRNTGRRRHSQNQPARFGQPLSQVPLQRQVQHERARHGHAHAVSTPGRPEIAMCMRRATDRIENLPVALVGQRGDVVAIDGDGLRSSPLAGFLPVAGEELDQESAGRRRPDEIDHVDEFAWQNQTDEWAFWSDGGDVRQEGLPARMRRRRPRREWRWRQRIDPDVVDIEKELRRHLERVRPIGGENDGPDVLARIDGVFEVRAGAVDDQAMIVERQRDIVGACAPHEGCERAGARARDGDAAAREVRLAARARGGAHEPADRCG